MQETLTSVSSPISVIIIIIALAVIAYLIYTKNFQTLRAIAYRLMVLAEQNIIGSQKGKERFNMVLHDLYTNHVPLWLKIFITEDQLKGYLQKWFYEIEDMLNVDKTAKPAEPSVKKNPTVT